MEKVKKLLASGISLPTAIKALIEPRTLTQLAEDHGSNLVSMSKAINGAAAPTDKDIKALVAEFGGTADEWRLLLWEQSKPKSVAV